MGTTLVGSRRRRAAIAATLLGLTWLGLYAAGRLAEWGPLRPPLWTDADGRSVSFRRFERRGAPYEHRGFSHCGWDRFTFIFFGSAAYIRDPEGLMTDDEVSRFARLPRLPRDARDTGWHRGDRRLFVGSDADAIFILDGSVIERWPRHTGSCL